MTASARTGCPAVGLGRQDARDPERLPSARCPTSLSDQAPVRPLFGVRSFTQHPYHPKRSRPSVTKWARRSVLPQAASATLAGDAGNLGKMPLHRFLQPTYSMSTREPLDSLAANALRRLRRGWRTRLTPSLQLRADLSTDSTW